MEKPKTYVLCFGDNVLRIHFRGHKYETAMPSNPSPVAADILASLWAELVCYLHFPLDSEYPALQEEQDELVQAEQPVGQTEQAPATVT